jgi:hypothetical protein
MFGEKSRKKLTITRGGGGGGQKKLPELLFLVPSPNPFWVFNNGGKKKENKILPKIVATFVYASSQGQRTHSTRTNFSSCWCCSSYHRCSKPQCNNCELIRSNLSIIIFIFILYSCIIRNKIQPMV